MKTDRWINGTDYKGWELAFSKDVSSNKQRKVLRKSDVL